MDTGTVPFEPPPLAEEEPRIRYAPPIMGEVKAIHIGPSHWPEPLNAVDEVEAIAGQGLVGDRKFGAHRSITIVSEDELAEAAEKWGDAIPPGSTRRQVTVGGHPLSREPGARLKIGDVIVEIGGDCAPCETMEQSVGPGARSALQGLAGVIGSIVEGGVIRVGDEVGEG